MNQEEIDREKREILKIIEGDNTRLDKLNRITGRAEKATGSILGASFVASFTPLAPVAIIGAFAGLGSAIVGFGAGIARRLEENRLQKAYDRLQKLYEEQKKLNKRNKKEQMNKEFIEQLAFVNENIKSQESGIYDYLNSMGGFNSINHTGLPYINFKGKNVLTDDKPDDQKEHLAYRTGYNMGRFLQLFVMEKINSSNDGISFINVLENNPELQNVYEGVKALVDFTSKNVVQTDDEFNYLVSLYNGKSLDPKNVYLNEKNQYSIIIEDGSVVSYTGGEGILPSYDIYTGPYSYNYKPTEENPDKGKPTTLIGLFAMIHDEMYLQRGYFDQFADKVFLNRINNNWDRYQTLGEKIVAEVAYKYFSTMGNYLSELLGKDKVLFYDNPRINMSFENGLIEGLKSVDYHNIIKDGTVKMEQIENRKTFKVIRIKNFVN